MKVKLKPMDEPSLDAVDRARICLEETRDKETQRAFEVIEKIHKSSDHRGDQIIRYVDKAKEFFKEMQDGK